MANFVLSSSSTTTTPTPSPPPPPPLIDQPRKRKLSDSSCCDYAYAYASYACASSSYPYSYPSPPATSATLKTPVDLPAFQEDDHDHDHDHEDAIDSSMSNPDLDGHHRRDRFRPPPSPPPTLLAPVQELPPDYEREREQRDEDVGPFSGLPTPVSPRRLWTDIVPAPGAGELFESPVEEDVDRQQQRNHVRFAFGPRVVDGDELAREDAFRPGGSGGGGTGDRASSSSSISPAGPSQPYAYRDYDRDYDRDFPPLSSLSALPPYGGGQARGLFDVVWRGGGPSTSTARATHAHARASVENHPQLALDTQSLSPRPPSARPDPLPLARSQSSLPSSSSSTQPIPMPMPIPVPVRIPVHRQPLPRDSVELRAEPMTPLSLSHPIPMQMMDSPVSRPIELEDEVEEDDPSRPPGLEPMDVEFTDPFRSSPPPRVIDDDDDAYHDPYRDLDHDPDPDFDGDLPPSSPSRRSLADLPELSDLPELADTPLLPSPSTYDGGPPSPRLISLPGAETDDALLAPESSSPPRPPSLSLSLSPFASSSTSPSSSSSSLGIFVPLSTAAGPQQPSTSARAPDVDFPPEALSLVDQAEIEGLLSLRKRAWFAERNAKRAELEAADAVKLLAAGVRLSPPVPGALAEWDVGDRAAVGREGEAEGEVDVDVEAEGQRRKAAGGDGNDGVRRRIQVLEMKRAEARRERKAWKEKGREVGCLLRKVLGPTIKEIEAGATATAIADDGAKVGKGERTCVGSGLVARMVLKRRDVARPLAGRRTSFERVESPLVEEGKPDEDEDNDEMDTADD